jgi:geranylgeranyl diphosphate synthase type I
MACQMADDVKGSFWTSADSGKPEAGDIRRRKKTLPLVWALEHGDEADRDRLRRLYSREATVPGSGAIASEEPLDDHAVADVLAILERSGAREHALSEARRYRDLALGHLEALPCPQERRDELAILVGSVIAA